MNRVNSYKTIRVNSSSIRSLCLKSHPTPTDRRFDRIGAVVDESDCHVSGLRGPPARNKK